MINQFGRKTPRDSHGELENDVFYSYSFPSLIVFPLSLKKRLLKPLFLPEYSLLPKQIKVYVRIRP